MKKYIICAILLMSLTTAAYCSIQDMHRAVLSKKSVVDSGLVGYYADTSDTVSNNVADEGMNIDYVCADGGTISYAHVFVGNTDTGKSFNASLYDAAGTTKLVDGSLTSISTGTAGWIDIPLDSTYVLVNTTEYRLCYGSNDDGDWQSRGDATASVAYFSEVSFTIADAMPATVAQDVAQDASCDVAIYFDNSATSPPA